MRPALARGPRWPVATFRPDAGIGITWRVPPWCRFRAGRMAAQRRQRVILHLANECGGPASARLWPRVTAGVVARATHASWRASLALGNATSSLCDDRRPGRD